MSNLIGSIKGVAKDGKSCIEIDTEITDIRGNLTTNGRIQFLQSNTDAVDGDPTGILTRLNRTVHMQSDFKDTDGNDITPDTEYTLKTGPSGSLHEFTFLKKSVGSVVNANETMVPRNILGDALHVGPSAGVGMGTYFNQKTWSNGIGIHEFLSILRPAAGVIWVKCEVIGHRSSDVSYESTWTWIKSTGVPDPGTGEIFVNGFTEREYRSSGSTSYMPYRVSVGEYPANQEVDFRVNCQTSEASDVLVVLHVYSSNLVTVIKR